MLFLHNNAVWSSNVSRWFNAGLNRPQVGLLHAGLTDMRRIQKSFTELQLS